MTTGARVVNLRSIFFDIVACRVVNVLLLFDVATWWWSLMGTEGVGRNQKWHDFFSNAQLHRQTCGLYNLVTLMKPKVATGFYGDLFRLIIWRLGNFICPAISLTLAVCEVAIVRARFRIAVILSGVQVLASTWRLTFSLFSFHSLLLFLVSLILVRYIFCVAYGCVVRFTAHHLLLCRHVMTPALRYL